MQKRNRVKTVKTRMLRDIEVSEVGMGCMAFSHGYGKIPDEDYSIAAIRNAYDHGCTFFDTAEVYSPNLQGIGHNERIVGKALQPVREKVVLATKPSTGNYKAPETPLDGSTPVQQPAQEPGAAPVAAGATTTVTTTAGDANGVPAPSNSKSQTTVTVQ